MMVTTWTASQKLLRSTGVNGRMLGSRIVGQVSASRSARVETAAAAVST